MGNKAGPKLGLLFCLEERKTTAEAVVHSLRWGAIRESDPFMSGSQPDVLTVSPIAPRLRYHRCVADYSQGKNSQSAKAFMPIGSGVYLLSTKDKRWEDDSRQNSPYSFAESDSVIGYSIRG